MLAKIKSTILILNTLVALTSATCWLVDFGAGDLPIKCKSFRAPTTTGYTVYDDSRVLSVELVNPDPQNLEYKIVNHGGYNLNGGIQFYYPKEGRNRWRNYKFDSEGCNLRTPGHMEIFKLTC